MDANSAGRKSRGASTPARPRRLVSAAEGAKYLDVSVRTMRKFIVEGSIPAYRVGTHLVKVDLNDLDEFVRRIPTATR